MTRPFFSRDRISHFDVFDRHATDVLSQMASRLSQGYPVDFQDAISRFTLDSATEFLFGSDARSLSAGLPYPEKSASFPESPVERNNEDHPANRFSKAFAEAQLSVAQRGRFGSNWRPREFWTDSVWKDLDVIDGYIDPILKAAVEKHRQRQVEQAGAKDVAADDTLLSHLTLFTQDTKVLRDEILNIMIAGRDTTAGTLTFTMYMLAEHPQVMQRLREEVLSRIGTDRPTYEDLREMKYLRAVIHGKISHISE
jgi:cytochrome P450